MVGIDTLLMFIGVPLLLLAVLTILFGNRK